jgi:hypothetical protein
VQGRGALRREMRACLRTGRALRVPHHPGRAARADGHVQGVDAWSRRVVGWAMAVHLGTELVLDHSDQGWQPEFNCRRNTAGVS